MDAITQPRLEVNSGQALKGIGLQNPAKRTAAHELEYLAGCRNENSILSTFDDILTPGISQIIE